MPESFTPREINDYINSHNTGPKFDPYGSEELSNRLRATQLEKGDIFAQAEQAVTEANAEAKAADEQEIREMFEFIGHVRRDWLSPDYASLKARTREAVAKVRSDQPLSRLDLALLYRVADITDGDDKPYNDELDQIVSERDHYEDYDKIFNGIDIWPYGIYIADRELTGSLTLPEEVQGGVYLGNLRSAKGGLTLPRKVHGDLDLRKLKTDEGIRRMPDFVAQDLNLKSLLSVTGLQLPDVVKMDIYLSNLTTAANLGMSSTVDGFIDLRNLKSTDGLNIPQVLGGNIILPLLMPEEEKQRLRDRYPDKSSQIVSRA